MPGSDVLTIISSVTRALVCASAGIEMSVARKKPAIAIESFNVASLVLFVFVVIQRNGNHSEEASNSRLGRCGNSVEAGDEAYRSATTVIRVLPSFPDINLLFTISIHDDIIYQQRFFSWPTEKEGLPFAEAKTC